MHAQTLDIIHTAFPRHLKAFLPDFLAAALHQLQALFPTFHQYYVLAADAVPLSSEDEKIELSQLASATLDFIAAAARGGKAKAWFVEANVNLLVAEIFAWTEMTADEVRPCPFSYLSGAHSPHRKPSGRRTPTRSSRKSPRTRRPTASASRRTTCSTRSSRRTPRRRSPRSRRTSASSSRARARRTARTRTSGGARSRPRSPRSAP